MPVSDKHLPIVAIVGRPNVGKSSLFNRILKRRAAVVHDEPGITRDRHYALVEWNRCSFLLIDTGGILSSPKTELELGVVRIVQGAIEQANAVIFIIEPELHPEDFDVADILRRTGKPVIVTVNKVDKPDDCWSAADAGKLGLGEIIRVSAKFGHGTGDLLDRVVALLPPTLATIDDEVVRIAVVGKPNVGKSSFVNSLLGQEVALVHPEPGTTRDAVNTRFRYFGKEFEIIDTAGLFRKQNDIEYFAALRTLRAIEDCDIAILLVDATQGMTMQDKKITRTILERYRSLVIAINKWDLIARKKDNTAKEFEERIRVNMGFLSFVPIVFISALTGQRVQRAMEILNSVAERMNERVQTAKLNELVQHLQDEFPQPIYRGRRPKILYAVQTDIAPPEFVFFAKMADAISASYRRYIVGQIRKRFGFEGVPLKVIFRDKAH